MSFSKEEVRTVIKFGMLLGKTALTIHAEFVQVLGEEEAPGLSTIKRWAAKFREGVIDVKDADRTGRPTTSTNGAIVELVDGIVQEDRRVTVQEIAAEIHTSEGSVWDILRHHLLKKKKCARWVPHLLTDEQKASRISLADAHPHQYQREGDDFLRCNVTDDETWARSYEPELKRQNSEWRSPGSPRPRKAVHVMSKVKAMHIIFYTTDKVLVDYPTSIAGCLFTS